MKRFTIKVALLAAIMFFASTEKANSGAQVLGIGGFSDDAFNTAIVGVLSSMEALSQIANSNTVQMMGDLKKTAEQLDAINKKIQSVGEYYRRSQIVLEMTAMTVNILNECMELVRHIYDNEQFLAIEEVEFFVHLLDYVVFDGIAEEKKKNSDKAAVQIAKRQASDVGGGALKSLVDVLDWVVESKEAAGGGNINAELQASVEKTYRKLSETSYNLRLMRRYSYAYLVQKRYRAGAFDNREYIRYVYYTKYHQKAADKW
ncbi:MAG: hypothetical protein LBK47_08040 [Prevotellaceae bacterium]|jgi:hypothetical protein|nr:hypothetical protein [Prevotellaceae bacterium]